MSYPILLFNFTDPTTNGVNFRAWSPIEPYPLNENIYHPLQQPGYNAFFLRVLQHLDIPPITIYGIQTNYGSIIQIDTELICRVPLNERANEEHVYIVTLMNRCISPIFFSANEANHFLNLKREIIQSYDIDLCVRRLIHGRL